MYKDIYEEANRNLEDAAQVSGISISKFRNLLISEIGMSVMEYKKSNTILYKKLQKARDISRIERKELRHSNREYNAMEDLGNALVSQLKNLQPICTKKVKPIIKDKTVGIIQISDTHFNEEVNLPFNKYNWDIASSRLKSHVEQSILHFRGND